MRGPVPAPSRNPQYMRGQKLLISLAVDPDQLEALDRVADRKRTSRSQLVREAIDVFLESQPARPEPAP